MSTKDSSDSGSPQVVQPPQFVDAAHIPFPKALNVRTGNIVENLKFFRLQYTNYLVATGADAQSETVKKSILLSAIGEECLKMYQNFTPPLKDSETAESTWTFIESNLTPVTNVRQKRVMFNMAVQQKNETYNTYFARLRKLIAACKYGENEEEFLLDKVIYSISDFYLRKELWTTKDITLKQAMDRCKSKEKDDRNKHFVPADARTDEITNETRQQTDNGHRQNRQAERRRIWHNQRQSQAKPYASGPSSYRQHGQFAEPQPQQCPKKDSNAGPNPNYNKHLQTAENVPKTGSNPRPNPNYNQLLQQANKVAPQVTPIDNRPKPSPTVARPRPDIVTSPRHIELSDLPEIPSLLQMKIPPPPYEEFARCSISLPPPPKQQNNALPTAPTSPSHTENQPKSKSTIIPQQQYASATAINHSLRQSASAVPGANPMPVQSSKPNTAPVHTSRCGSCGQTELVPGDHKTNRKSCPAHTIVCIKCGTIGHVPTLCVASIRVRPAVNEPSNTPLNHPLRQSMRAVLRVNAVPSQSSTNTNISRCESCGLPQSVLGEHIKYRTSCPAHATVCSKCGNIGHFDAQCVVASIRQRPRKKSPDGCSIQ